MFNKLKNIFKHKDKTNVELNINDNIIDNKYITMIIDSVFYETVEKQIIDFVTKEYEKKCNMKYIDFANDFKNILKNKKELNNIYKDNINNIEKYSNEHMSIVNKLNILNQDEELTNLCSNDIEFLEHKRISILQNIKKLKFELINIKKEQNIFNDKFDKYVYDKNFNQYRLLYFKLVDFKRHLNEYCPYGCTYSKYNTLRHDIIDIYDLIKFDKNLYDEFMEILDYKYDM